MRTGEHRHGDRDTSRASALMNREQRIADRMRAFGILCAVYPAGLTDFELGALTGRQQTSIGKRRFELMEAGFVEPMPPEEGDARRPAPSGSPATVWRATPAGLAEYRSALPPVQVATIPGDGDPHPAHDTHQLTFDDIEV